MYINICFMFRILIKWWYKKSLLNYYWKFYFEGHFCCPVIYFLAKNNLFERTNTEKLLVYVKIFRVLSLGRTVVFGGQYHFFFEGHSKCMMKMKCGDKTALVDIAVAICPGSNQISVAFGKKMHSVLLVPKIFNATEAIRCFCNRWTFPLCSFSFFIVHIKFQPRYTSLFNIVRKEVHPQRGQLTGVSHFVLLSKPTQNDVKPASSSAIQQNALFNHSLSLFPMIFRQFHKTLISLNLKHTSSLHFIIRKYSLNLFFISYHYK